MREDDIRRAIQNLPGDLFDRFARELLRRELYPGLNPTSPSHDLGEDARTEPSVVFLHGGKRISVFASKTANWAKIEEDCKRCRETRRQIDVAVFVTAGNPRTDIQEIWREKVRKDFGWDLEVRTIAWLGSVASAPQHEKLVDDYLHIPPPHGDFTDTIEKQFSDHTDGALKQIRLLVPGIPSPLHRDEIERCEERLGESKAILLTGEAGTGKSGIAKQLTLLARKRGLIVLLLDARSIVHIKSEAELRQHFDLRGPVLSAIHRVGRDRGCRLVVDQLDNAVGSIAATLLAELMGECYEFPGVEVALVSRRQESREIALLDSLLSAGFVEVISYPLNESRARRSLQQIGIPQPPAELVELGRNLLNLEIIGTIRKRDPFLDFSSVLDEVDLWDQYRQSLSEREGEEVIAEAVKLAREGLRHPDGMIVLAHPTLRSQRRLVSSGVIVHIQGRVVRFSHEKMQDFMYAWDATERGEMPAQVLIELGPYRSRNVIKWMASIYAWNQSPFQGKFLKEVLDVRT